MYNNIYVRIWNVCIILTLPIVISFGMLIKASYSLYNTHAQQRLLRRNHHRQLIKDSLIFYTIWIILWSPWMFISYMNILDTNEMFIYVTLVMNLLEVLVDPFISFFLDKRFAQAWIKCYRQFRHLLGFQNHARVNPLSHATTLH